jgi:hypothetical protein
MRAAELAGMSAAVDEVRRRRTFAIGELSVEGGSVTDAGAAVRLRRGPDGRWYPFTLARVQWWPAGGASSAAGVAYQAAVPAKSLRRERLTSIILSGGDRVAGSCGSYRSGSDRAVSSARLAHAPGTSSARAAYARFKTSSLR